MKLAKFITSSCNKLNNVLDWLGGTWCIFLTKYLYNALGFIQRFIGGTGYGLQLIQQFIQGMLADILPLSFILRYMMTPVANVLNNMYSQPSRNSDQAKQEAKPTKVQPQSKIASANIQSAKASEAANAAKKADNLQQGSKATGVVGSSLKQAVFVAGASFVLDMVAENIASKAKNSILDKLWPSNINIFDFQDAIDVIANIIYYIFQDQTCTSYLFMRNQANYSGLIPCPTFAIDPVNADNPSKSIDATLCWASAVQSLGQSSAYSCTPSSTCCAATGCSSDKSNLDICANCPAPSPGMTQFACDNMVCKCSVPVQKVSHCSANSMCDASSFCDLISSISSVSYGTLACRDCPGFFASEKVFTCTKITDMSLYTGKLVCLASYAGVAAKCSCLMDVKVSFATCFEPAGTITYPDSGGLCGYLPRLSTSSSESTFQYSSKLFVFFYY